ncbi:hypothetical protein HX13_01310 [Chryseobacterium sp. P1-3]|uniref:hypothetical protein n=1 Tax=Chryseobacterium sp. (strain P1-3) TaxID=1517683 RepID=UPI0004E66C8C|nr:hypothetical protein [Chryseobacterium sp. P1-3]KFF76017.1 hypothetical protein HX13_01310 [Chryseobacterium sp. P1-3]
MMDTKPCMGNMKLEVLRKYYMKKVIQKRNSYAVVWILWIFLLIVMPQNLSAQRYEHLEKLVKDTEEMKFPQASDNGKWLAWYIFASDGTKKMMLQSTVDKDYKQERKNIDFIMFVESHLAIQAKDTLEYLNPETGKFRFFLSCKKNASTINSRILLWYCIPKKKETGWKFMILIRT